MANPKQESNLQRKSDQANMSVEDIMSSYEALYMSREVHPSSVDELFQTQQALQLVLDAARIGTWDWDLVSNKITWSKSLEPLHGLKPGEFATLYEGKFEGFQRLIHPQDIEMVNTVITQALKEKSYYNIEFRVVWPDESIHWIRGQGRAIYDENSYPLRMVGIGMDITERKQAEDNLRQSEERFRVAIKNSPILVFNHDTNLVYTWLYNNPAMGSSDDWVLGKTDADMLPAHEAEPIMAIKRSVIETGSGTQAEIKLTLAGKLRYFMLTVEPLIDTEGAIMGITCAAFDITERKQSERMLLESEERFRNMADTAPVLVWVSGTDTLYNFFNKPWLDFTGRTFEQEKGNGWLEGVHPDDLQQCRQIYLTSFETRQPFRMEYRLRQANGEYRWVLDTGVPRIMPDGTFAGYIGSCIDITERKQYEDQLRRSERLKQEIFEGSADALFLVNARTNLIEEYNEQASSLFGFENKKEFIGTQARSLYKNAFTKAQLRKILQQINEHKFWTSEVEFVSKSGREFWGNSAISSIHVDGAQYFLIRIRDISERKKAEEEIARSQQELLLEKHRTEQALAIIEKDNQRKTKELEEARVLQLSMLPQSPPDLEDLDIAMYMKTCVEVGGDYYDYKVDEDGSLTVILGDATGHGLKAGIVVATVKSYFQTLANQCTVSELLARISEGIQNLQIRGMYMGVTVIRIKQHHLTIASSGMPPLYLYTHASKQIEQITLKGLFLGSSIPFPYQYTCIPLQPGDTLLALSDGLPELFNNQRQMLDYGRIQTCFAQVAHLPAENVIAGLNAISDEWAAGHENEDDISIIVIKAR